MNQFFTLGLVEPTLTSHTSHEIYYVTDEQKPAGTLPLMSTNLAKQLYTSYYDAFGTLSLLVTATEPKIDT